MKEFKEGYINSIDTMGLVDGPGIRIIIFMQGCKLRCIFCHNPETWNKKSNIKMTSKEVVDQIRKYRPYIEMGGGVTFSGGEPLYQSEFLVEMLKMCKKAGIHEFIETLPNGYNTILRENGSNISGGQKQMISIARTILSDAEVLLLDDITTSLDPDTAKLVPKLINNLKKDHTIIMITKKPELMKEADRIVVLDNGKINDVGTHKQLIGRNEIYQMLQSRKSPSRIGVFDND